MKVAVCISGIPSGDEVKSLETIRKHLPYDVFAHSWEGLDFDPKYPLEIKRSPQPVLSGGAKVYRLFNHWYCMQQAKDYDVIIRTDYHVILGNEDWSYWVDRVYNEKIVVGFETLSDCRWEDYLLTEGMRENTKSTQYKFKRLQFQDNEFQRSIYHGMHSYIGDDIVIHRREMFNDPYTRTLVGSEQGWYWNFFDEPHSDRLLSIESRYIDEIQYQNNLTLL
jgi:hypothetical protein